MQGQWNQKHFLFKRISRRAIQNLASLRIGRRVDVEGFVLNKRGVLQRTENLQDTDSAVLLDHHAGPPKPQVPIEGIAQSCYYSFQKQSSSCRLKI